MLAAAGAKVMLRRRRQPIVGDRGRAGERRGRVAVAGDQGLDPVEEGVGRGSLRCYAEILEVACLAEFESVEQRMGGTGTVTFDCAADAGATTHDGQADEGAHGTGAAGPAAPTALAMVALLEISTKVITARNDRLKISPCGGHSGWDRRAKP